MIEIIIENNSDKVDTFNNSATLIISILGVVIALITFYSSRKHNRLSVKPIAYILPQDYEDKICVILQNKGTGPLISTFINFKDVKINKNEKSLINHMPSLKNDCKWRNFSKAQKFVLSPNESKILLELDGNIGDKDFIENRDLIRKKLADIEVNIKYTSIYNEYFKQDLKYKLDWYARSK
jgi:hypothetical protein